MPNRFTWFQDVNKQRERFVDNLLRDQSTNIHAKTRIDEQYYMKYTDKAASQWLKGY